MKYKIALYCLLLFTLLFAFLQLHSEYHYYYVEQNQLFLNTWPYLMERLALPGGGALILSEFLVQFFAYPYAGALISAALLTGIVMLTASVLYKIAPLAVEWPILAFLPALSLLLIQFDFNYFLQGTVAFLLMLLFIEGYSLLKSPTGQFCYTFMATLLLFWFAGPVALLFAVSILLYQAVRRSKQVYWYFIPIALSLLCGLICIETGVTGDYRLAFLPDLYYHHQLKPETVLYFSWIALLLAIVFLFLLRKGKTSGKKRLIIQGLLQLLLLAVLFYFGLEKYDDRKSEKFKRFDYYARTGQWDAIIDQSKDKQTNYLYLSLLNLALAEKGELADRAFTFDQKGVNGIFPQWNKTTNLSILLSDLFFAMGNIANAQEMAFEAYISAPGYGNPRMLKRLIQTNLIYGHWAVAEKYITLLEQTVYYRNWAHDQRRFLRNEAAVEQDPLLGGKRKCLPTSRQNVLVLPDILDLPLSKIAEVNPSDRTAIEYLGTTYLVCKEMNLFQQFLDQYYGTDILPALPRSFQEAVIILHEKDPEQWKKYGIGDQIIRRFTGYKQQVLAYKNDPAAPGLLHRSFGDTYWFYFMFK